MNILAATSGSGLASALIAVVIAFAILVGIVWGAGHFFNPQAQKIAGIICGIIWVLFALSRFGFLSSVEM